jgi:hypothetical protein
MSKLATLVLALALLGAATAATADTMSCSVAGTNPPVYTPDVCDAFKPGISYAWAKFRVDPAPPLTIEQIALVQWTSAPHCNYTSYICSVLLNANVPKTMTATVLYHPNPFVPWSIVYATASFENGQ